MKPHEYPRIKKKSICGDSGDLWPLWNRGIKRPLKKEDQLSLNAGQKYYRMLSNGAFCNTFDLH